MGMAASQVRLLALTDRLHDIELKSQQILAQKLALGTQKDALYNDYCDALEATNYMVAFRNDNGSARYVDATYQNLCTFNEDRFRQYSLTDTRTGKVLVSQEEKENYDKYNNDKYAFALAMLGIDDSFGYGESNGVSSGSLVGLDEATMAGVNTTYLDGVNTDTSAGRFSPVELELLGQSDNANLVSEINSYIGLMEPQKKADGTIETQDEVDARLDAKANDIRTNFATDIVNVNDKFGGLLNAVKGDGNDVLVTEAEMLAILSIKDASKQNYLQGCMEQVAKAKTPEEQLTAYNNFRDALYENLDQEIYNKTTYIQYGDNVPKDLVFEKQEFDFYVNKWEAINQAGGCDIVDARYEAGEEGREWLENMVKAGLIVIQECGKDGWQDTSVATSTNGNFLIEDPDDDELKKAEAEYEHELDIIDRKETKMDNELAKLETERKAITTEMDSLKTVRDDNIDRTFGIFG